MIERKNPFRDSISGILRLLKISFCFINTEKRPRLKVKPGFKELITSEKNKLINNNKHI